MKNLLILDSGMKG